MNTFILPQDLALGGKNNLILMGKLKCSNLTSTTLSFRDAALEWCCVARCIEPAVWTEML